LLIVKSMPCLTLSVSVWRVGVRKCKRKRLFVVLAKTICGDIRKSGEEKSDFAQMYDENRS
jgi:hypothetical protein